MMGFSDPRHPLWSLLRFIVLMAVVAIVMHRHASAFDATEIAALKELAIALVTLWAGDRLMIRNRNNGRAVTGTHKTPPPSAP